jgi:hypothetical protein
MEGSISTMNYRFNLEEWLPRLPLEPQYGVFSGEIITYLMLGDMG